MRLWIIVPTLNEARGIDAALRALQALRSDDAGIVVADGGSDDDTVPRARALADHVLAAPRGRARQMNAGAAWVRGHAGASPGDDILVFLHADTRLPPAAPALIRAAIGGGARIGGGKRTKGGALWGRFDVRLSGAHWLLRVVEFMMNARSRLSGIATGDQTIFVRRDLFEQLGGFADIALMEDVEFSRRAKRVAAPACLSARVETSSRRWEQGGVLRTILLMMRLRLAYFFGADPRELARRYAQRS
jgi:rSAM/selenodomain-associated transferase 2